MTHSPNNSTANLLEAEIDKHGLLHVLIGLELICAEKAAHIRVNWQDEVTANLWDKASNKIGELARKFSKASDVF